MHLFNVSAAALYNPANNEECILKDTKAREAWEATFDTKYIKQVFANEVCHLMLFA